MCQVDDGETEMRRDLPRNRKAESRSSCVKCSSTDVVIPHGANAALCQLCFANNVNHKFRATVAKSQLVRQGEAVLLAHSLGTSSSAMLSLVAQGLKPETARKIRFSPGAVLHIDQSSAETTLDMPSTSDVRDRVQFFHRSVTNAFAALDLPRVPCLVAPIEYAMTIDDNQGEQVLSVDIGLEDGVDNYLAFLQRNDVLKARKKLHAFLGGLKSATSKLRAIQLLRKKLTARVGRSKGFTCIMEGTSATRVAIDIMTDLALGRGTQIPQDVGLIDRRFQSTDRLVILRPLREFTDKETSVYNNLNKVETYAPISLETKAAPQSSIQRATEEFVLGLQRDFSSTVSTVWKTGEKLVGRQNQGEGEPSFETCSLCKGVRDVPEESTLDVATVLSRLSPTEERSGVGGIATASRALDLSAIISRHKTTNTDNQHLVENFTLSNDLNSTNRVLCLSCRVISREIHDNNPNQDLTKTMPTFVVNDASLNNKQRELRDKISDFLLDENDD